MIKESNKLPSQFPNFTNIKSWFINSLPIQYVPKELIKTYAQYSNHDFQKLGLTRSEFLAQVLIDGWYFEWRQKFPEKYQFMRQMETINQYELQKLPVIEGIASFNRLLEPLILKRNKRGVHPYFWYVIFTRQQQYYVVKKMHDFLIKHGSIITPEIDDFLNRNKPFISPEIVRNDRY